MNSFEKENHQGGTVSRKDLQRTIADKVNRNYTSSSQSKSFQAQRPVTYVAPARDILNQIVKETCEQLTNKGETGYDNPEVRRRFEDFLNFAAELTAKYLNKGVDIFLDR